MALETTINGLMAASVSNTTDLTEVEQSIGGGNYVSRKVLESQRISLYNTSLQLSSITQISSASAGGIFYSDGAHGALLNGTATANQVLLSGASAAPTWSTATYPATTTINQLLYSSSNNVITGLASVNNSILTTNGSGVPTYVNLLSGALGGTGVANTGLTINLGSGGVGKVLTSDVSGNATWTALSGVGVTSVQGTAGQILANATSGSPQTGAIILTIDPIYAGQTSIVTLGTITTGTWTASIVALAYGGSNANLTASNGGIVWSNASQMQILAGTATANKMLLSGASATPSWSTSTIPSSAGATANKVLLSDGTNYVLSTPTFPNASATSGKIIISDGTNWVPTTTTYPSTNAINTIMYASSANVLGVISAANNGVLISSAGGVPSWLAAGSTGQILVATTGSPPSWSTFSSFGVSSAQGTANQVLVNATSGSPVTGAITLTTPQNIDTAATVQFGILSLGSAASSGTIFTATITASKPISIQTRGSITVTSAGLGSFILGDTITASTSVATLYGAQFGTTIGIASGQTLTTGATLWVFPTVTGTGTITNFMAIRIGNALTGGITTTNYYGIYYDGDVAANVATNSWGAYFKVPNPNSGTAKTALYADNFSVGYTAGSPIYKVTIQGDDSAAGDTTGSFGILANSNSNQRLHMGYATSGDYGWIEAVKVGSSLQPLMLQPRANASVVIWTTSSQNLGFALEVAGTVNATTLNGRITTQNANDTLNLGTSATNFFMDRPISGGQLIFAFNTPKPAGSFNPFTVYNNATDHLEAFAVISAGSSSGTDNVVFYPFGGGAICMGGSAAFSGSYLNIITNSAISQTIRITGTQSATDGNSNMMGFGCFPTFAPAGGSNLGTGAFINPAFVAANSQTMATASGIYINLNVGGNVGTISQVFGLLIDSGNNNTGTVTNGYGLRVENPVYGSTKTCISCRGRIVIGEVTGTSAVNLYYTGATANNSSGIVTGGSAQGIPANPVRWMAIVVNGSSYAFPLYNESFI